MTAWLLFLGPCESLNWQWRWWVKVFLWSPFGKCLSCKMTALRTVQLVRHSESYAGNDGLKRGLSDSHMYRQSRPVSPQVSAIILQWTVFKGFSFWDGVNDLTQQWGLYNTYNVQWRKMYLIYCWFCKFSHYQSFHHSRTSNVRDRIFFFNPGNHIVWFSSINWNFIAWNKSRTWYTIETFTIRPICCNQVCSLCSWNFGPLLYTDLEFQPPP